MKRDGSLASCIARLYETGYHTNWTAPSLSMPLALAASSGAAAVEGAADSLREGNEGASSSSPRLGLQDLLFSHR